MKKINDDLATFLTIVGIIAMVFVWWGAFDAGFKLYDKIKRSYRPTISDNIEIDRCKIHDSYSFCISSDNKPYSYSINREDYLGGYAGCQCYDDWENTLITHDNPNYELIELKFKLGLLVQLNKADWEYFQSWYKINKEKTFYGMYKSYGRWNTYINVNYSPVTTTRNVGRAISTTTTSKMSGVSSYQKYVVDVVCEPIKDEYIIEGGHTFKDNDFNGMFVEGNYDKLRYTGPETKYNEDVNWYLRKDVDPIDYFVATIYPKIHK